MDDLGDELVWRVRALALAKRMRAADPHVTNRHLADAIARQVEGVTGGRDKIERRLRVWENTGALPVKRRVAA